MKQWTKLVAAIVGCELVGILATPFTIASIPTWYATLEKPFFSPPNWIFGPVWTILYFLMGVSLYLIWKTKETKKRNTALFYFGLQLFLNFMWSILFFGLHSPLFALLDVILLEIVIILTLIKFYKISKIASYILIPYILWVFFASILNLSLLILNW